VVESQRRLYNLGVFNRVTIEPQNPNGTDPERSGCSCGRSKRYTLAYGGGFEVQRLASTRTDGGEYKQLARNSGNHQEQFDRTRRFTLTQAAGSTIEDRRCWDTRYKYICRPALELASHRVHGKNSDINTFKEIVRRIVATDRQRTPRTTLYIDTRSEEWWCPT